jgi:hypothetical protein
MAEQVLEVAEPEMAAADASQLIKCKLPSAIDPAQPVVLIPASECTSLGGTNKGAQDAQVVDAETTLRAAAQRQGILAAEKAKVQSVLDKLFPT